MIESFKTYMCLHVCENKNELGFCRTAWCINPSHSKGTYAIPQPYYKLTNGAKIRAMTDEELAKFITSEYYQPHCPVGSCPVVEDCEDCWLRWLKEEVEE